MVKKFILLVSFVLVIMADSNIIQKSSKCSVSITVDKLEYTLKEKGITIFARIDHSKNASDVNLTLNESEVLIFGNPNAGTKIMQKSLLSGLDLPLRVLVYKDKSLQTKIAYHNPMVLKEMYNLKECKVIDKISEFLENSIKEVISTPCGRK